METPTRLTCSDNEHPRYAFIRIYPKNLERIWAYVKFGLIDMKPLLADGDPDYVNSVLRQILAGRMQLWLAYTRVNDEGFVTIDGFAITYTAGMPSLSGVRSLYVYSLYSFKTMKLEHFALGQKAIEGFAKSERCKKIRAEVAPGQMSEWVEALGLGYKTVWTTVEKEITDA